VPPQPMKAPRDFLNDKLPDREAPVEPN